MEDGRELLLDAKEVTKQGPKLRGENCSPVADNRVEKAVVLHYYIDNFLRKAQSIDDNFNWFVVHYLCQTVNNDKN